MGESFRCNCYLLKLNRLVKGPASAPVAPDDIGFRGRRGRFEGRSSAAESLRFDHVFLSYRGRAFSFPLPPCIQL